MKSVFAIFILVYLIFCSSSLYAQPQNTEAYIKQREYRQALEALRPQLGPRADRDILNLATRACLGLRQFDSAYLFAKRSLEEKENAQSLLLFTISAREANKVSEAFAAAHKLVRIDSNNPIAIVEAGATAVAADSLNLATKWLIAARELNPNEPTVHEYLGDVYFKQTVYELAKGEYQDALRLDSSKLGPRWRLARIAVKQKQFNEALTEYRKILQIDSTEYEAYFESANLYYAARQYNSAIANYLKYLQNVPENAKARVLAAKAHNALKQYGQVIDILHPIENAHPPNVDVFRLLAEAHFRSAKYEHASMYFDKLLASGQGTSEDYQFRGVALSRLQKMPEAISDLQKAIELDPNNGDAHFELGLIYYRATDYENALTHYRKKAELDTTSLSALLNIGYTEFQLERYDSAATTFKKITTMKSDNLNGFLWLGRSYAQLDSLMLEEGAYQRVIELGLLDTMKYKKERAEAHFSIGYLKAKQNQQAAAIDHLKLAIQIDDTNADTFTLLAQVYAQMNKRKEATDACKKALKLDPKNANAQKLLQALQQPPPPPPQSNNK